ncbi:MAG: TolC family protein, partial [Fibrobacterales bacterium]|nr:TolC family protein [Fibrobacterales bacterium]
LRDDVETLWRALRLDLAKRPSADLSLRAAEQSYLRAQEKQKLGDLSYSDLLQEKTSFDSARLSRQRLRWSLLENSIRLRILRGAYGR